MYGSPGLRSGLTVFTLKAAHCRTDWSLARLDDCLQANFEPAGATQILRSKRTDVWLVLIATILAAAGLGGGALYYLGMKDEAASTRARSSEAASSEPFVEGSATAPAASVPPAAESTAPREAASAPSFAPSRRGRPKTPLRISSNPMGAEVRVDGALVGITPLLIELPPGDHKVSAELEEYGIRENTVRLKETGEYPLAIEFKKTAILQADSDPPGAEVFVDDTGKGKTPVELELSLGEHAVRMILKGYPVWQDRVRFEGPNVYSLKAGLASASPASSMDEAPAPPPGGAAPSPSSDESGAPLAPSLDDQKRERMVDLLIKAQDAYDRGEFFTPDETGAVDYYKQVFAINDQDSRAYDGMIRVVQKHLESAGQAVADGDAQGRLKLSQIEECLDAIPEALKNEHRKEIQAIDAEVRALRAEFDASKAPKALPKKRTPPSKKAAPKKERKGKSDSRTFRDNSSNASRILIDSMQDVPSIRPFRLAGRKPGSNPFSEVHARAEAVAGRSAMDRVSEMLDEGRGQCC